MSFMLLQNDARELVHAVLDAGHDARVLLRQLQQRETMLARHAVQVRRAIPIDDRRERVIAVDLADVDLLIAGRIAELFLPALVRLRSRVFQNERVLLPDERGEAFAGLLVLQRFEAALQLELALLGLRSFALRLDAL